MKTRLGFVSNSSSSSFVLLGKVLTVHEKKQIAEHYKLEPESDGNVYIEDVEDFDVLYDDGEVYAGWEIANGSDYSLNESHTKLSDLKDNGKVAKLREIIGDFEPELITGERFS